MVYAAFVSYMQSYEESLRKQKYLEKKIKIFCCLTHNLEYFV